MSVDWPDSQRCQISPCSGKKCARYPLSKIYMLPEKWTKIHRNPLRSATHPSLCQISWRSAKRCTRKALQNMLISCSILAPQGSPRPKLTNLGTDVRIQMCQILFPTDNLSTSRHLLANVVDFVESTNDKKQ